MSYDLNEVDGVDLESTGITALPYNLRFADLVEQMELRRIGRAKLASYIKTFQPKDMGPVCMRERDAERRSKNLALLKFACKALCLIAGSIFWAVVLYWSI